jgi:hypothetical protein
MRLDDLVVIGLLAAVLVLDAARGVDGPALPVVLAAVGAVAYLIAGRRRAESAPSPFPPRCAPRDCPMIGQGIASSSRCSTAPSCLHASAASIRICPA